MDYDIGDRPTLTVTFRDTAGVATNPSAVAGLIMRPNDVEGALGAPTNTAPGVYVWTMPTLDMAGRWTWRVKATAGLIAAQEGSFVVKPSRFKSP